MKLAIEFNGLYWHSSLYKPNNYHQKKWKACQDKGIRLIQIWEHDWILKQSIIKKYLNNIFINKKKVYARKCQIKSLTYLSSKEFIDDNHIQGSTTSGSIYYGLYYNNKLVQLMSFVKKSEYYEISRLCTKSSISVIGGANKLFNHFIKNINPEKVITYSSNDHFTGHVYEKMNMNFASLTQPRYFYAKNSKSEIDILSRQQCQKHKLIKMGYDPTKSEHEIMLERGYYRCYDSGNKKFEWIKNSI